MKNKIETLRDHLFDTIEALKKPDNPMEVDRARAIADVARVIVDSAKAEVDFLKITGEKKGTGFISIDKEPVSGLLPQSSFTAKEKERGYSGSLQTANGHER